LPESGSRNKPANHQNIHLDLREGRGASFYGDDEIIFQNGRFIL
jgi:hypothetical protein